VPENMPHVVIVGAGVAGLAAAFFLRDQPVRVTVLEGSPRLGGKLAASQVAGVMVDSGAEALLARRPEGTELVGAVGLADELVPAATTSSGIWSRGELHPLPRRQFMGVPADLDALAETGVMSPAGLARAARDRVVERDGDVSVREYIGGRLGNEVVDRLVDPLLGGVYAGLSAELSLEATLGPLAVAAGKYPTLTEAAASLVPAASAAVARPVFVTLAGGLGSLPAALARASGADIRLAAMVRELTRMPSGWRLTVGPAVDPEFIHADAVLLAVPARPASRLLSGTAAAELAAIPYSSMAIVTLAYPAEAAAAALGGRSGYLVPAVEGRAVKAVTFSSTKWAHLARGHAIVRCSIGRMGEETVLQREDAELSALAHAELASVTGLRAAPVDTRVTRWGGGLPQYTVGHLDRVARIRSAVAAQPGLAVAGAAYDGVGIPACVATARRAVDTIMTWLKKAPS
jgi:oxygen-dependent protoporphyrinogen oxidase